MLSRSEEAKNLSSLAEFQVNAMLLYTWQNPLHLFAVEFVQIFSDLPLVTIKLTVENEW
jgi:hypothetical protein